MATNTNAFELSSALQERKILNKKLEEIKKQLQELEKENRTIDIGLEDAQRKVNIVQRDSFYCNADINDRTDELEKANEELEPLKTAVEDSNKLIDELNGDIQNIQLAIDDVTKEIARSEEIRAEANE